MLRRTCCEARAILLRLEARSRIFFPLRARTHTCTRTHARTHAQRAGQTTGIILVPLPCAPQTRAEASRVSRSFSVLPCSPSGMSAPTRASPPHASSVCFTDRADRAEHPSDRSYRADFFFRRKGSSEGSDGQTERMKKK